MTARQPLVAANWKMHGTHATVRALLTAIKAGTGPGTAGTEIALCAPFVYLAGVLEQLQESVIAVGAQNVSEHEQGAFTGEISAGMLQDCGCRYVIVGHSERRTLYHESDRTVAEKFVKVRSHNMVPILCVGEQLQERESSLTEEVISRQLSEVINLAGIGSFDNAVIAYEPVWAIGTGRTATPEQAEEVHEFLRLQLARFDDTIADKIRILYGGSVKPDNAGKLFSMANIDGGLIGGASLNANDFLTICASTR